MISKHAAVMSVVIWGLTLWASPSQADLGGTSPRWSEADIADLNGDLVTLLVAEYRLRLLKREMSKVQSQTRQKQMLGIDDDGASFADSVRTWWLANVVDPARRIAGNPAAPCRVAQIVLTKLLEAERQAQLLGMAGGLGGDLADPDSVLSGAVKAVKRRCLEQAYDACLASGNGQHIILMLTEAVRQLQLLSLEDAGFEAQAVYLYRRCTVYQLRYHSESWWDDPKRFKFGASYDGSVILLSDVDPAGGHLGLIEQNYEWKGPRPGDPDDVIVSVTDCLTRARNNHIVCGPPQPTFPAQARIKAGDLAMKRFYDEIEVNLTNDETELDELARLAKRIPRKPPITWTRKSEGADGLTLTYKPGMVISFATISSRSGTLPPAALPPSQTLFLTAHSGGKPQALDITLGQWTRVGTQVLFEKPIDATATIDSGGRIGKSTYGDTTKFELAHRPDLFPPDEIVVNWELTPAPKAPAATRRPLRPPAAPR